MVPLKAHKLVRNKYVIQYILTIREFKKLFESLRSFISDYYDNARFHTKQGTSVDGFTLQMFDDIYISSKTSTATVGIIHYTALFDNKVDLRITGIIDSSIDRDFDMRYSDAIAIIGKLVKMCGGIGRMYDFQRIVTHGCIKADNDEYHLFERIHDLTIACFGTVTDTKLHINGQAPLISNHSMRSICDVSYESEFVTKPLLKVYPSEEPYVVTAINMINLQKHVPTSIPKLYQLLHIEELDI